MDTLATPPAVVAALDALERALLRDPAAIEAAIGALRRALAALAQARPMPAADTLERLRQRGRQLAEMARLRLQSTARLQRALEPVSNTLVYSRRG
ncbi:hypothetical protein JN531_011250 [Flagellatimonas centrodinii]|uniref:hypothetical protein n=1 Tax=Flagellatimonas centrodinii TaxID=2806210 RepID=UPI001FEE2D7C|nr:hypothetical protein [Flagellatimonas centrodinii]ULQ45686.1 hypothetical protein JN531_011250 [Flagellatimonas centrodinii]